MYNTSVVLLKRKKTQNKTKAIKNKNKTQNNTKNKTKQNKKRKNIHINLILKTLSLVTCCDYVKIYTFFVFIILYVGMVEGEKHT